MCNGNRRLLAYPEGSVAVLCSFGIAVAIIHLPGFVGFVEDPDVRPGASRDFAVAFDSTNLVAAARDGVWPDVARRIRELVEVGYVQQHWKLLARCTQQYGRRILLHGGIPWISVVVNPGIVNLITAAEFLASAKNSTGVRVSSGYDPWEAVQHSIARFGSGTMSELHVILPEETSAFRSFRGIGEEAKGRLSELWPGYEDEVFMGTIVLLLAEAWGIPLPELDVSAADWHRYFNKLNGRFVRRAS